MRTFIFKQYKGCKTCRVVARSYNTALLLATTYLGDVIWIGQRPAGDA